MELSSSWSAFVVLKYQLLGGDNVKKDNNRANLKIVVTMKELEFVFPICESNVNCAEFINRWVAFVRDPQAVKMDDVEGLQRVKLLGEVYGKPHFTDGEVISTAPVVKIEKLERSEVTTMDRFYSRICRWRKIRQVYCFVTESESTYVVPLSAFAKQTIDLMDAARYGAIDEMRFRRGFF